MLIQEVFGEDAFPSLPEIDRGHRIGPPRASSGGRPRPVIICFHRYQSKELLTRKARGRNELKYRDKPLRIYEGYSPEVVNQRRVYRSVMYDLYKMGLKPSLLYSAQLRITKMDGVRHVFGSVTEAEKFVEDSKAT